MLGEPACHAPTTRFHGAAGVISPCGRFQGNSIPFRLWRLLTCRARGVNDAAEAASAVECRRSGCGDSPRKEGLLGTRAGHAQAHGAFSCPARQYHRRIDDRNSSACATALVNSRRRATAAMAGRQKPIQQGRSELLPTEQRLEPIARFRIPHPKGKRSSHTWRCFKFAQLT